MEYGQPTIIFKSDKYYVRYNDTEQTQVKTSGFQGLNKNPAFLSQCCKF